MTLSVGERISKTRQDFEDVVLAEQQKNAIVDVLLQERKSMALLHTQRDKLETMYSAARLKVSST